MDMDKRLSKANAKPKEVKSEYERLISKIKDLMAKVNKSEAHCTKAEDEVSTLKASLEEAMKKLAVFRGLEREDFRVGEERRKS